MLARRLMLAIGLVLFGAGPLVAQPTPQPRRFVPGELLIGFRSPQDREAAVRDLAATQEKLRRGPGGPSAVTMEPSTETDVTLRIDFPGAGPGMRGDPGAQLGTLMEIAKQLRQNNPGITYAQPNWIVTNQLPAPVGQKTASIEVPPELKPAFTGRLPNDPDFVAGRQWDMGPLPRGMNAIGAWQLTIGSPDVVVAVIDSGLVYGHDDVKGYGNVLPGQNFVFGENRVGDGEDLDTSETCGHPPAWHGSHVAGTIGAVGSDNARGITGIAWRVSVLPVRTMRCNQGTTSDILSGLRWAAGMPTLGRPRNEHPAQVVNMSIGGSQPCTDDQNPAYIATLDELERRGVVVVVAAGNDAEDIAKETPSGCRNVISVGATDERGRLAFYSNFGDVSVLAPGGDIRKLRYPDGRIEPGDQNGILSIVRGGTTSMMGTSMACPHVAGAVALALAAHPNWRGQPALVRQKLRETAVKPKGDICMGRACGPGQLDAAAFIASR